MIRTTLLCKDYPAGKGVVHALREIDLQIAAGEFVAIMGPSGSGKSTLMNLIGCLDRPTSGAYELDGQSVASLSDRDLAALRNQKVGFVFQTFNLLPSKTALGNVELPLMYSPASDRRRRALQVLESVGILDRAEHKPSDMSGGQQQRVAIARAIVTDPKIILADEPTGNLDSHTSEEILALLQDLSRRGRTIVLVTHEEEIARHCGRIVRFRVGRIVRDEPVVEPIDARRVLAEADLA